MKAKENLGEAQKRNASNNGDANARPNTRQMQGGEQVLKP